MTCKQTSTQGKLLYLYSLLPLLINLAIWFTPQISFNLIYFSTLRLLCPCDIFLVSTVNCSYLVEAEHWIAPLGVRLQYFPLQDRKVPRFVSLSISIWNTSWSDSSSWLADKSTPKKTVIQSECVFSQQTRRVKLIKIVYLHKAVLLKWNVHLLHSGALHLYCPTIYITLHTFGIRKTFDAFKGLFC